MSTGSAASPMDAGASWREFLAYADELTVADVEGLERARGTSYLFAHASAAVVAYLLARNVEKEKISQADADATLARITPVGNINPTLCLQ